MNSPLADLHDDLRAVAQDLLAGTSPLAAGGEPVAPEWALLAEAGWLGLEVPERLGGAGATFAEVAVVLEELGRVAAAGPFLGGAVLGPAALGLAEPAPVRDELLASVAAGRTVVAVALPTGDADPAGPLPFRLERSRGALRLAGRAAFVPDAAVAERVLVVAGDAAGGAALVDTGPEDGLAVTATPVVDPTRELAEVSADGVAVAPDRCWPLRGDPRSLAARGALAVAVDALGVAQAALDATVAYAGVRHQFGRPIGSFQAVKHQCADVAVDLAVTRRLVVEAVGRVVDGAGDAGVAVSMAKAHAGEAAVRAAGTAIQLHGGIGYTWEHGLHVLFKRAALDRSLFGSPAAHRASLARRYGAAATV